MPVNERLEVTYFRPRRPGPEYELEEAVARHIAVLLPSREHPVWVAGSVPIGAGMPDLVIVTCRPELRALAGAEMTSAELLAYLRGVRGAKLRTIAERVARPAGVVDRCLDALVEAKAVSATVGVFRLTPSWYDILGEIVAVEAKVTDWQGAVSQAARNRLFAHRSYVALPGTVTARVRAEPIFQRFGLGLLSALKNGDVRVTRRPRRRLPRVWAYYYKLALIVAPHFGR